MTLQTRIERDVVVLDIEGRLLGGPETEGFRTRVTELVEEGHRRILLNLAHVPYANSLAIGAIIASYVTAKRAGAQLEICCPASRIVMILRNERIIPVLFDEYATEAEAMAGFDVAIHADPPKER